MTPASAPCAAQRHIGFRPRLFVELLLLIAAVVRLWVEERFICVTRVTGSLFGNSSEGPFEHEVPCQHEGCFACIINARM